MKNRKVSILRPVRQGRLPGGSNSGCLIYGQVQYHYLLRYCATIYLGTIPLPTKVRYHYLPRCNTTTYLGTIQLLTQVDTTTYLDAMPATIYLGTIPPLTKVQNHYLPRYNTITYIGAIPLLTQVLCHGNPQPLHNGFQVARQF